MGFKTGNGPIDAPKPPEFTTCFPRSKNKYVDGHLELSCTVTGSPYPQVFWFYNDKPIDECNFRIKFMDGNTKLVIRRLRLEDAGVYSCLLKNVCGEKSHSCEVQVERNPLAISPAILQQPDDITCCKGRDITISCISSSEHPVARVFVWLKNGQTVRESSRVSYGKEVINETTTNVKLSLSNAQFSDQGTYCLLSSNLYGDTMSKGAILDVY